MFLGGEFCLVGEIDLSENKAALIVLVGTVAGAATTFVASTRLPLFSRVKHSYLKTANPKRFSQETLTKNFLSTLLVRIWLV
jgi:hypothetical protein